MCWDNMYFRNKRAKSYDFNSSLSMSNLCQKFQKKAAPRNSIVDKFWAYFICSVHKNVLVKLSFDFGMRGGRGGIVTSILYWNVRHNIPENMEPTQFNQLVVQQLSFYPNNIFLAFIFKGKNFYFQLCCFTRKFKL